jgi:hypothetical protein
MAIFSPGRAAAIALHLLEGGLWQIAHHLAND